MSLRGSIAFWTKRVSVAECLLLEGSYLWGSINCKLVFLPDVVFSSGITKSMILEFSLRHRALGASQYTKLEKQPDITSPSVQLPASLFLSLPPPHCDSFLPLSDSDFSFYIGVTNCSSLCWRTLQFSFPCTSWDMELWSVSLVCPRQMTSEQFLSEFKGILGRFLWWVRFWFLMLSVHGHCRQSSH